MTQTKVKDLTVDELKGLIKEVVTQTLFEVLSDPDEGLELRPEAGNQLRRSLAAMKAGKRGASLQEVEELVLDAYPLGIRADTRYRALEVALKGGDYVVFCSDGLIEAANASGELFGFERLGETIRQGCREGLSSASLVDRLIGEVQAFAGEAPQGDDRTCVVIRVG